jgi:hypothetical protein
MAFLPSVETDAQLRFSPGKIAISCSLIGRDRKGFLFASETGFAVTCHA